MLRNEVSASFFFLFFESLSTTTVLILLLRNNIKRAYAICLKTFSSLRYKFNFANTVGTNVKIYLAAAKNMYHAKFHSKGDLTYPHTNKKI